MFPISAFAVSVPKVRTLLMVWTLVPSDRSKELRTEIKVGAQVFGYLF